QNFNDDRDLWISDSKFKKPYKITDANPQQKEYKWGSVEIVEWTTFDGKQNRGLLFLPEGYQKGKNYPAIVNFYETHTGEKNIYPAPSYSAAMLDVATYVSNGYIIFMPDVTFVIGEPGKSSYNIVVSGTKALIKRGILDAKRIGLQGHSWSGYQAAYLATKTDIFACINTGAPIVNMTSGYNGLREGSGLPRMFMYEDWQCRMGSSIWGALDQYIESSPILYADKIAAPLLISHSDKDEAVSYAEGRSLFLAMRRLQKTAWLLNYKGEGHFMNSAAAQHDWTRRMRQFFDYYLNGTQMPRWMSEGI
ncbi:MAG: prolyl oligopeptidase family serine peptidase, partial [Rikenellaceae bacterium]